MSTNEISFYQSNHFVLIFAAMLLSGVFGGLANYFLSKNSEQSKGVIEYLILGIVASFTVPLFLNMISSNLIEKTITDSIFLFVFIGFCLIASVFSRKFLENIYNKLANEIQKIKENVENIENAATEPDKETDTDINIDMTQFGLTEIELSIMKAMNIGKYIYRGITGLENDTKYPRDKLKNSLSILLHKDYIKQKFNTKGQKRWYLSERGKEILTLLNT